MKKNDSTEKDNKDVDSLLKQPGVIVSLRKATVL